jgi:hypothetical protein
MRKPKKPKRQTSIQNNKQNSKKEKEPDSAGPNTQDILNDIKSEYGYDDDYWYEIHKR